MGWFNTERPPEKYDRAYMRLMTERIRTSLNFLDDTNFPNGLHGSVLRKRSVWYDKMPQLEIPVTLIALASPFVVSSTTFSNVGGFYHWANAMGTGAKMAFEVTGSSATSSGTATFELRGAEETFSTLTTNTGTIEWLRSELFDPPTESQTLIVRAKTSSGSVPAGITTARIILFTP